VFYVRNIFKVSGRRQYSSRQEAVRWKQEIDRYIEEHKYGIGALVAFSGEVLDEQLGLVTENSKILNRNLNGRDIREAFDTDEYRILLVANKFQTGFDQDKLCGMYIDKKLGGIQAVQTLSRLNRARPGKDTTYVLDFVNDVKQVLEAFKTYYTTAKLEEASDPNQVLNLRAKLDAAGFYDDQDVERLVTATMKLDVKHSDLGRILEPVADRVVKQHRKTLNLLKIAEEAGQEQAVQDARDELETLELFKADIGTFQHLYTFMSQIVDFGSTAIEKRYIFFKYLLPLLEFRRERESIDLTKIRLTHYKLRSDGQRNLPLHEGEGMPLKGLVAAGSGMVQTKEKALLEEILEKVNQLFEGELTDDDKVGYIKTLKAKLIESDVLVDQATNNTKEQFANSSDLTKGIEAAIISALEAHTTMSRQALGEELLRLRIKEILLGPVQLYETLKGKATAKKELF
jgi:type I restriction enzyme R subunit